MTVDDGLGKEEFKKLIGAYHAIFEIFEKRYDAHKFAVRWAREWLDLGFFEVTEDQRAEISLMFENFDYDAFNIEGKQLRERIAVGFRDILEELKVGRNELVGFALAPYFSIWNIRRFETYFRQKSDFSLRNYFKELSDFLEKEKRISSSSKTSTC
ncbi:MAG: hypothetical protein QXO16_03905 [Archaeoglobaceae archaeon]